MTEIFQVPSGADILIGLVVTAAVIALIADWRLALFALSLQYVLLALLLAQLVQPALALVRVIAGQLAATILYLTMRHIVDEERAATPVFIVGFPFRLFAVAFVGVSLIGVAASVPFLDVTPYVLFSALWLIAIGVLIAILAREALRLGLGLLVFTSGFTLLETAIEGSLFLFGLINIFDLLVALVVAHLATLPHEIGERRRRGEARSQAFAQKTGTAPEPNRGERLRSQAFTQKTGTAPEPSRGERLR